MMFFVVDAGTSVRFLQDFEEERFWFRRMGQLLKDTIESFYVKNDLKGFR